MLTHEGNHEDQFGYGQIKINLIIKKIKIKNKHHEWIFKYFVTY